MVSLFHTVRESPSHTFTCTPCETLLLPNSQGQIHSSRAWLREMPDGVGPTHLKPHYKIALLEDQSQFQVSWQEIQKQAHIKEVKEVVMLTSNCYVIYNDYD